MDTKDDTTKMTKLRSLQCLCEITLDRFQSGTKIHRCILLSDPISDGIISDLDVESPLYT